MAKGKKKNKKKIGWWKWPAKWFGKPLISTGRQAAIDFIDEQPIEDFAVLSADITLDVLDIYTDLNDNNKQQIKDLIGSRQDQACNVSVGLLLHILPKLRHKGMFKGNFGDTIWVQLHDALSRTVEAKEKHERKSSS